MDNLFLWQEETQPGAPGEGDNPPPQGGFGDPSFIFLMVGFFLIFYFLMIRPAKKQQKEREAMLGAIAKNDHVITNGGIKGVVVKVEEKEVVLRVDDKNDVRMRFTRSAVGMIEKKSGASEKPEEE